jgi:hypothetical protein
MKNTILVLIILLLGIRVNVHAQFPPADQNFNISIEDEFTSFDGTVSDPVWENVAIPSPGCPIVPGYNYAWYQDPANVNVSGDGLEIWGRPFTTFTPCTLSNSTAFYPLWSGALVRSKTSYKYGYFEAKCKFPANEGFWDCFWLYGRLSNGSTYGPCTSAAVTCYKNEIDIMEPFSRNQHTVSTNIHRLSDPNDCTSDDTPSEVFDTDISPLSISDWQVYSFVWTSNLLQWFVNGVLIREDINNCDNLDIHFPMQILLDTYIDNQPFPTAAGAFEIDYLKAYKLKTTDSNQNPTCGTTYNYTGDFASNPMFEYGVRDVININGTSSIPVNASVTLRAAETNLYGLFEVPESSEFCIMPTICE